MKYYKVSEEELLELLNKESVLEDIFDNVGIYDDYEYDDITEVPSEFEEIEE